MGSYAIQEKTLQDLAEAARRQLGIFDSMTPYEMTERLNDVESINVNHNIDLSDTDEGPWIRPNDWPDLDSLNLQFEGDQAFVYMTYDANKEHSCIAWQCSTWSGQWTIDIGHISNGEYIVDETSTLNNYVKYFRDTSDLSGYLVLRITGDLKGVGTTGTKINDSWMQSSRQQPILERISYLPKAPVIGSDALPQSQWSLYSLEREVINNGSGEYLTSISCAFQMDYSLKSLDISGLNTKNVTNMNSLFYECLKLKQIPIQDLDFSNCIQLNNAFEYCFNLTDEFNLEIFAPKLQQLQYAFAYDYNLTKININFIDEKPKIQKLSYTFNYCHNVNEIIIKNVDGSNLSNMIGMFQYCINAKYLDVGCLGGSNSCGTQFMFAGCWSLTEINMFSDNILSTNSSHMFESCKSLRGIDLSHIKITNICTSIDNMFSYCYRLTEINIPTNWDLSGLNGVNNATYVFYACWELRKITGIKNWNLSGFNLLNATNIFNGCHNLKELDISDWNVNKVNSIVGLFQDCWRLETLDISKWTFENCTSLGSAFRYCYSLTTISLPEKFCINSVVNLSNLFDGCYSLQSIDASNWDTSSCTNFNSLFLNCRSLKSLGDITSWDTSKVTTMYCMFQDCYSLTDLPNIQNWDFSNVTDLSNMFCNLYRVKRINLPNLNLPKVTKISNMFIFMYQLESANVSGWSTPLLNTAPGPFFGNCWKLKDLIPPTNINLNHQYLFNYNLTYESIIQILTSLPTVSVARTISITAENLNRLTAADKAIATQKGWTVAA